MKSMNSTLDSLYNAERQRLISLAKDGRSDGDYLSPVFGEGCICPRLMLIGEAPGKEEAASTHPFVGKAGRQLNELLELAKLDRNELFVTNAVKFRPVRRTARSVSNRTPTAKEIISGRELLYHEIETVKPRVIATLGNSPLASVGGLCGMKNLKIGDVHGKVITAQISGMTIELFPLYHPASGIYNRELVDVMRRDIIKLGDYIKEEGV